MLLPSHLLLDLGVMKDSVPAVSWCICAVELPGVVEAMQRSSCLVVMKADWHVKRLFIKAG